MIEIDLAKPMTVAALKSVARERAVSKIQEKRQAVQSSIGFPYMDLETAIAVARAMLDAGGVALTREQLSGVMKTTSGNGTFITKVATARTFGLIVINQGKYELTNLGFDILSSDEHRRLPGRADAFLNVPLYKRTYDEFKGKQLPPKIGLENAFVNFGVAPKQAYNARLAFERSADQAGFFAAGPDRLVKPILRMGVAVSGSTIVGTGTTPAADAPARSSDSTGDLDQLIVGLLRRLPKPGEKWEIDKRARWLQTLAANFDMVYQSDETGKTIVVELKNYRAPEG